MGDYKKPIICDSENIMAVNKVLQKVEILCGDFEQTLEYAEENTLFYFDPPYKPLSLTSSFNSYSNNEFSDTEQIRLNKFCNKLDCLNYDWILSNSDVKGKDVNDNFFDDLYADFNIQRVDARRNINAKSREKRFF
jgi:DNA adenine methylase